MMGEKTTAPVAGEHCHPLKHASGDYVCVMEFPPPIFTYNFSLYKFLHDDYYLYNFFFQNMTLSFTLPSYLAAVLESHT